MFLVSLFTYFIIFIYKNYSPKEVISVGSSFKDDHNFLSFQDMKVVLDSDICNRGIIVGSFEEEEYLLEIGYNATATPTDDVDDDSVNPEEDSPLEEETTSLPMG